MEGKVPKQMQSPKSALALVAILALLTVLSCKLWNKSSSTNSTNSSNTAAEAETGVEKVKPAAGTGNVQGKVFYNSRPAENIEVKLCESFNLPTVRAFLQGLIDTKRRSVNSLIDVRRSHQVIVCVDT